MAAPVFYIPGAQGDRLEKFRQAGLAELCGDDGNPEAAKINSGPDGGSGILYAFRKGDPATDPSLDNTDALDWTAAPPEATRDLTAGRFWLGVDRDRPVVPDDLIRKSPYAGGNIRLADGNDWFVPIMHRLPHTIGLDPETGKMSRRIADKYAGVWQRSEHYAEELFRGSDDDFTLQDLAEERPELKKQIDDERKNTFVDVTLEGAWKYCTDVLSLNYRIDETLVSMLGLLDDPSMCAVIIGTLELDEVVKVRQKKTLGICVAELAM